MKQAIKQTLAKFWLVFSWKGMKTEDRLKLWGTELCALILLCTIENLFCILTFAATLAMFRWTKNTIDREALDDIMDKLDDEDYGK